MPTKPIYGNSKEIEVCIDCGFCFGSIHCVQCDNFIQKKRLTKKQVKQEQHIIEVKNETCVNCAELDCRVRNKCNRNLSKKKRKRKKEVDLI